MTASKHYEEGWYRCQELIKDNPSEAAVRALEMTQALTESMVDRSHGPKLQVRNSYAVGYLSAYVRLSSRFMTFNTPDYAEEETS